VEKIVFLNHLIIELVSFLHITVALFIQKNLLRCLTLRDFRIILSFSFAVGLRSLKQNDFILTDIAAGTGLIKTSVVHLGRLGTFQESTFIKKIQGASRRQDFGTTMYIT
jgi:hypothetical protein